jgi:hypothetical protein
MSTELNMEAERADDLAAFKKWKGYELPVLNNHGQFHQDWLHREFVAFCAGRRRTAPVSAPIVEELPALPRPAYYDRVSARMSGDGIGFTEDQYRQGQRDAIAPYAERIRQLERELKHAKLQEIVDIAQECDMGYGKPAERKTASIGDHPKFCELLDEFAYRASERRAMGGDFGSAEADEVAESALIAYIDGRTAGTARHVSAEVTQKELLLAMDKWGAAGFVVNDRAVNFLNYFLRERAAAPTPKNSGKEEA